MLWPKFRKIKEGFIQEMQSGDYFHTKTIAFIGVDYTETGYLVYAKCFCGAKFGIKEFPYGENIDKRDVDAFIDCFFMDSDYL